MCASISASVSVMLVWRKGNINKNWLCATVLCTSSSHMCVMNHNWSATKQHLHPPSVAEINRHSVLSGNRIRQCETSSGSRHNDTYLMKLCIAIVLQMTLMHYAFIRVSVKCGMRNAKVKCGMQSAECTWLATKQNQVTLPIPQFTTSRLAMHGKKMRKVIRGNVTLCVITSKDLCNDP